MAVTVSVTALKFDITSTGGVEATMQEVVAAVGDTAVIEQVGTVITLKRQVGQLYREFEISANCIVRLEEGYTFNIEGITNTSTYTTFEVVTGGKWIMEADTVLDLNSDNQLYGRAYLYMYGEVDIQGTLGHEAIIKKYRSMYISPRANQNYSYLKLQDNVYSAGYFLCLANIYDYVDYTVNFDHITIENTNANYWGYGIFCSEYSVPLNNYTFDNFLVQNCTYPIYMYGGSFKMTNSTFKNTSTQAVVYSAGNVGNSKIKSPNITPYTSTRLLQCFQVFENCTFDDLDYGIYGTYFNYAAIVLLENCTIQNQSVGVYSGTASVVYELGTTTFNSVSTPYSVSNNSGIMKAHRIGITVQDLNGDPVSGACVAIYEDNEYERFTGLTDSNGEMLTAFGDKPVMTKSAYYTTSSYEDWSAHTVAVSKDGYGTEYVSVDVDSDKDIIVTLTPVNTGGTVINGATLNGCTIY